MCEDKNHYVILVLGARPLVGAVLVEERTITLLYILLFMEATYPIFYHYGAIA
jgi:hypothetical protein